MSAAQEAPGVAQQPRVALLISSLRYGGAERVTLNLAQALKAAGFTVDVLLMSAEGELLAEARANFTVVDLRCGRTWELPLRLLTYLRESTPDVLISSFWKLSLCACFARVFRPSTRLILWEHAPPSKSDAGPAWLFSLTATILYQLSTKIVAVSSGVLTDLTRITVGLRRKTTVIFNPVAPPPLTTGLHRKSNRMKTIVWVGRLDVPKNPHLMLYAFSRLGRSVNCRLQIIGAGRFRKELEDLCVSLELSERVDFLGFRADAHALMARADLLVLTSDSEGLPTVLIEGLYAGLPVVSTDCGAGVHDILVDGLYGSIVPAQDQQALATAIERELRCDRDPVLQQAAAERFRPEVVVKEFIQAWR